MLVTSCSAVRSCTRLSSCSRLTAPEATLIRELGERPSSTGRVFLCRESATYSPSGAYRHVCAAALPLLQSPSTSRVLNGGEVTSGGLHRRSTASGEREASDHAHHIWIVPAQHMGLLHPAVLLGRQQYRRLVQAEASSRRHPDSNLSTMVAVKLL